MASKKSKNELYFEASKIALENSILICDEAKLLNKNNYSARGLALAVISLEESAKAFLLQLISLNVVDEQKTMSFVRKHDKKLLQSSKILTFSLRLSEIIYDVIEVAESEGKIKNIPIEEDFKKNIETWKVIFQMVEKLFQKIKLDSIYVDVREGRIIDPNRDANKTDTSEMIDMAKYQITIIKTFLNLKNELILNMLKEPIVSDLKIEHLLK